MYPLRLALVLPIAYSPALALSRPWALLITGSSPEQAIYIFLNNKPSALCPSRASLSREHAMRSSRGSGIENQCRKSKPTIRPCPAIPSRRLPPSSGNHAGGNLSTSKRLSFWVLGQTGATEEASCRYLRITYSQNGAIRAKKTLSLAS